MVVFTYYSRIGTHSTNLFKKFFKCHLDIPGRPVGCCFYLALLANGRNHCDGPSSIVSHLTIPLCPVLRQLSFRVLAFFLMCICVCVYVCGAEIKGVHYYSQLLKLFFSLCVFV